MNQSVYTVPVLIYEDEVDPPLKFEVVPALPGRHPACRNVSLYLVRLAVKNIYPPLVGIPAVAGLFGAGKVEIGVT